MTINMKLEDLYSMKGKVCVVTGGSSGLGSYMARGFLAAGAAKVYVTARTEDTLQAKAAELSGLHDGECIGIPGDLATLDGVSGLSETLRQREDHIDVLVNNAGTSARTTVEETTEEIWDAQMDVHAKGVFLGTKHAIPEMRKAGGGSIINVSSMYGLVGSPM